MAEREPRGFSGRTTEPRRLPRKPEATAVVEDVRHAELRDLGDQLDRLTERPRSRKWSLASQALLTVALGACLSVPLLFDNSADYPAWVVPVYLGTIGLMFAGSLVCRLARGDIDAERVASIDDIKKRVQAVCDSFEPVQEDER